MAYGIIGWGADGQPIYGDAGDNGWSAPNPAVAQTQRPTAQSTIDPSTGQPRPVNAPSVRSATIPQSTLIPGTNTQRPVNMPYNPIPEEQSIFDDWSRTQGNLNDAYEQWGRGSISQMQGDQANWESQVGGLVGQLPGITNQQNAARTGNAAGYRSALEGYQASDQRALGDYIGANNSALGIYNQRANDLYNTSVPMLSASQWSSNPQDIANQQQALGNFSDIYGGGLDYQAAQAQAVLAQLYQYASDPTDVERQKQAAEELHGLINGGEWNENLRDVTKKYKDLSDPEVTAQERFILEQFNQRREGLERSKRDAVSSNLASRGLLSGSAEQTGMMNAQQQLGQEGVLAELGAQANAIGRSQQAMQGWSQASQAGRQAQLAAQGMYVDATGQIRDANDRVGMFNTAEANTTERYNAGLQTQTNQFNAGQTNIARANNQATRLSGAQGFAAQSNAIRQADDYVGTFNMGQQNLVNMQNQRVTLEDLTRKGELNSGQLRDNSTINNNNFWGTIGVNATGAQRAGTIHTAQQDDIDSFAGNQRGDVGAQIGYQGGVLSGRNAITGATADFGSSLYGPTGVFTATNAANAGGRSAINQNKYRLDRGQSIYG